MRLLALLLLCTAAFADSKQEVIAAMREYYGILASSGNGNIESVRDRLIAHAPEVNAKTQKSVRTMIDRGFNSKYKKDAHFHKCLAQVLAAMGDQGMNKLYQRYKKMKRSHDSRAAIAEAFGGSKSKKARGILVKIIHDKEPVVAAAAMKGLKNHIPEDKKAKRNDMRELVDIYTKVTAKAQGKEPDSKERKAYDELKPVLDDVLNAYSGDEKLDSAAAWDAWLREQAASN
ncbi:MAG: hypothetical protein ACYTHK_04220 [Planctomycetota bacterium]